MMNFVSCLPFFTGCPFRRLNLEEGVILLRRLVVRHAIIMVLILFLDHCQQIATHDGKVICRKLTEEMNNVNDELL